MKASALGHDRLLFADAVRAVAIILVVVIHVSAPPVVHQAISLSHTWWVANLFDSLGRPAVPLFVMLSGLLLLDTARQESPLSFLRRRMLRVLVPFLVWCPVYFYWRGWYHGQEITLAGAVQEVLTGPVYTHLWFVYMLIGLYIAMPLLKVFVECASRQYIQYFLILWLLVSGILPILQHFSGIFPAVDFVVTVEFTGYLLLGHALRNVRLSVSAWWLAIAGLAALVTFTALATYYMTLHAGGVLDEHAYGYQSPNVIAMSVLWFLLIKSVDYQALYHRFPPLEAGVSSLAGLSYGIYLFHPIVQELLQGGMLGLSLSAGTFEPLVSIPFTVCAIVLISAIVLYLLRLLHFGRVLAP